jgi:cyanate permease
MVTDTNILKINMVLRRTISVLITLCFLIAYLGVMYWPTANWLLLFAAAGCIFFLIRIIRGDD